MELDFTRSLDYWWALLPEIVLCIWGTVVLIAGVSKRHKDADAADTADPSLSGSADLGWLALVGVLAAGMANGWLYGVREVGQAGMIAVDPFRLFANWVLLLGASLTSRERVLGLDEDKKFCGFYLDCHMQVAVTSVDTVRELGLRRANGLFYVVTLRVSSDAVRARLNLIAPRLVLSDSAGRTYDRVPNTTDMDALAREIGPEESFQSTIVFDVPEDAADLRLHMSMGFWVDRLVEKFLIGDEDSVLHKRTSFRIAA